MRFERAYQRVTSAADRRQAIRGLADEQVIEALAAASRANDSLLANVLATEALNRMRRLRASLANLGEGVLTLGPEAELRWMNPAAERLLGWTRENALGMSFHDLIQHKDAQKEPLPEDACGVLQAMHTGKPQVRDGEYFVTRGGADLCVAYTSAPLENETGDIEGIVLAFQDCGDRKRAERAMKVGQQRYKSLFDHLPDPIVSVATDGRIDGSNPAAEALTGRSEEDALGREFREFLHEDDTPAALALFSEVLQGERREADLRVLHVDGRWLPVHVMGVPVVVDGSVVGVHGILRGLNERAPPADAR